MFAGTHPRPNPRFCGIRTRDRADLASCWGKSFFYTQFIILQVISKNYNLLVEVPFYTEDMVSKYLNYFDSQMLLRGSDERPGSSHPGSHQLREAAVHRYGEVKVSFGM